VPRQLAEKVILAPRATRDDAAGLLVAHLAAGETAAATAEPAGAGTRVYADNEHLWNDLLQEHLWATATVALEHFWLSEWLPLRPGLFHTPDARRSRRMATRDLLGEDRGAREMLDREARRAGRHLSDETVARLRNEAINVLLPRGKARMLDGGVGSIRLRPRQRDGGALWFLGASSTPVAHEGMVVALGQEHYDAVIADVRAFGAVRCTLRGRLAYLPSEFDPLYRRIIRVPQLHLDVEELVAERAIEQGGFIASGAVLVRSDADHVLPASDYYGPLAEGLSAAYVSFPAGVPGAIETACEWLSSAYVDGVMGGTVLTDFDEQVRRFPGATFELEAVRGGTVPRADALDILNRLNLHGEERTLFINRLEVRVGDEYVNQGQVGAMGSGARAENMSLVQIAGGVADAVAMARELGDLRRILRSQADEPEHDEAVGIIEAAERDAQDGNIEAAVEKLSGLRRLRAAGPWALGAATSIGSGVVAGVLRSVLGV
jgi:hypothetical protein